MRYACSALPRIVLMSGAFAAMAMDGLQERAVGCLRKRNLCGASSCSPHSRLIASAFHCVSVQKFEQAFALHLPNVTFRLGSARHRLSLTAWKQRSLASPSHERAVHRGERSFKPVREGQPDC